MVSLLFSTRTHAFCVAVHVNGMIIFAFSVLDLIHVVGKAKVP